MKKILIFCTLIAAGVFAKAQSQDEALAFEENKFVWSGIDLSHAKMIGSEGFTDVERIKNYFFDNWNQLMVSEPDKFDFKKFYGKNERVDELSVVTKQNELPEVDELVINEDYSFEPGQLEKIVADYKGISDESDLGLLYVVENFSKTAEAAKIHVVFYNTNTGKIAWSKQYISKAGGFGFRNYWAGAINNTLKTSGPEFVKEAKKFQKGK